MNKKCLFSSGFLSSWTIGWFMTGLNNLWCIVRWSKWTELPLIILAEFFPTCCQRILIIFNIVLLCYPWTTTTKKIGFAIYSFCSNSSGRCWSLPDSLLGLKLLKKPYKVNLRSSSHAITQVLYNVAPGTTTTIFKTFVAKAALCSKQSNAVIIHLQLGLVNE